MSTTAAFTVTRRNAPLLVSFPHAGTAIPPDIAARLTPVALTRPDTDWHLPELYDFCTELDATTIVPTWSRYVIDLNRPPEDANLYPGQDTTGLVPVDTFRKEPLYRDGQAPDAAEIAARRETYWQPYHAALAAELDRLRARHRAVLLWEAHSIASVLPRFFTGKLPDFNLGSAGGASCAPAVQAAAEAELGGQRGFTWVSNGRFQGGYITRRYGAPARGVHALQMEICQCIYMDESPPFAFDADRARAVRPVLRGMIEGAVAALGT